MFVGKQAGAAEAVGRASGLGREKNKLTSRNQSRLTRQRTSTTVEITASSKEFGQDYLSLYHAPNCKAKQYAVVDKVCISDEIQTMITSFSCEVVSKATYWLLITLPRRQPPS